MPLTQQQCTDAITRHSRSLADVATDQLDRDVEFCPGWSVLDLVHHVTQVHWFWATIVEDRLTARPTGLDHPVEAPQDQAIAVFRAGADHLVAVLTQTDPATHVWTWAPARQDAGFVVRHQVQEIVVHHWDAAHAVGGSIEVDPEVGADCVDEMLEFSVVNAHNMDDDPLPPALAGTFAIRCTDSDHAWVVTDGEQPGTSRISRTTAVEVEVQGMPAVTGTGGQLILWLYARLGDPSGDADTSAVDDAHPGLLDRFRKLCDTD